MPGRRSRSTRHLPSSSDHPLTVFEICRYLPRSVTSPVTLFCSSPGASPSVRATMPSPDLKPHTTPSPFLRRLGTRPRLAGWAPEEETAWVVRPRVVSESDGHRSYFSRPPRVSGPVVGRDRGSAHTGSRTLPGVGKRTGARRSGPWGAVGRTSPAGHLLAQPSAESPLGPRRVAGWPSR